MAENKKSGRVVDAAFKSALETFGGCFERVLDELEYVTKRLADVELLVADLSQRLDNFELREGIVKTQEIAEASFKRVRQLEPEVNAN